jgi:hypothetical protein
MSKKKQKRFGKMIIGPVAYEVVEVRDLRNAEGRALYGQCYDSGDEIRLTSGLKPERQRLVLLHESLHAIDNLYLIGLSEEQIHRLAVGLRSAVDDNPDLLKGYPQA